MGWSRPACPPSCCQVRPDRSPLASTASGLRCRPWPAAAARQTSASWIRPCGGTQEGLLAWKWKGGLVSSSLEVDKPQETSAGVHVTRRMGFCCRDGSADRRRWSARVSPTGRRQEYPGMLWTCIYCRNNGQLRPRRSTPTTTVNCDTVQWPNSPCNQGEITRATTPDALLPRLRSALLTRGE